jgi:hypothetical protein
MNEESFRQKLIPYFSEIQKVKFSEGFPFPSVTINLDNRGILSDGAAEAIVTANEESEWLRRHLVFIHPLKELRNSPQHVKLTRLLWDSLDALSENGVTARPIDPPIWFSELEKVAPSIVREFCHCAHGDNLLHLPALREIPDNVALEFGNLELKSLDLSGLEEILSTIAGNICGNGIETLVVDGVKRMSLESAMAIAERFKGRETSLLGLIELSTEVHEILRSIPDIWFVNVPSNLR